MLSQKLKDNVLHTYKNLNTYYDFGYITEIKVGRAARQTKLKFETWFCKPDLFKLNWQVLPIDQEYNSVNTLCLNQKGCTLSKASGKVTETEDIFQGLSMISGITKSVSMEVPSLLFGWSKNSLEGELTDIDIEIENGSVLEKYFLEQKSSEIYRVLEIEKDRNVLLRVEEHSLINARHLIPPKLLTKVEKDLNDVGAHANEVLSPYSCVSEIIYSKIQINSPISNSIFSIEKFS